MTSFIFSTFEYEFAAPPFPVRPTEQMTAQEARRHFDWFVEQEEARCQLLIAAVLATSRVRRTQMDYSRASLVLLWSWMMRWIARVPTDEGKQKEFLGKLPPTLRRINFDFTEFTVETLGLCFDAGFYLARYFRGVSRAVGWELGKAKDCKNRPYLTGFKWPLIPSDILKGCCGAFLQGDMEMHQLQTTCDNWTKDLPRQSLSPSN